MLVMTSGNLHNEPIVTDDDQALVKFAGIADAVLGNDRRILSRYDDSVLRVVRVGDEQAIQFGGYCICTACRRKLSAL